MGAAPGPCPVWRRRAPGPGLALTPWPPPAGERGPWGEGAGRGRGRPGQSAMRGPSAAVEPHQGRGPGPHPWPRTAPRGRACRQALGTGRAPVGGIQRWAWGRCSGGAGDGCPVPTWGEPRDPEGHFWGHRSLASGSAIAPLLREPALGGGRKKEPRAASLQWRMRPTIPVGTRKRKT